MNLNLCFHLLSGVDKKLCKMTAVLALAYESFVLYRREFFQWLSWQGLESLLGC